MICKDNQKMIDALLRLKVGTNNKIPSSSYQQPDWKTRKDNESLCVNVINEIMDANQTQNKVASLQSTKKIGEVAEFQSLLHAYLQTN
jgi:hypothetical protein